ncbi:beta strand repeat-containing protein [Lysobacter gummosus]|uniref:beta strand repeat-containing protein n=1 Tax=Lysobacter gummosus TaxID=262324 RepID=UPI00363BC685
MKSMAISGDAGAKPLEGRQEAETIPNRAGGFRRALSKLAALSVLAGVLAPMGAAHAQTCGNLLTNEFNGTFGTMPLPGPPTRRNMQNPQVPNANGYVYQTGGPVAAGDYTVTSGNFVDDVFPGTNHWENITGHNAGGPISQDDAFMTINGQTTFGQVFYSQDLVLVGGQSYTISVWGANAVTFSDPATFPRLGVRVRNLATNAIVPGGDATTILLPSRPNNTTTQWFPATVTFTVPSDGRFRFELYNAATAFSGNDFVMDDMSITAASQAGCPVDFGDAPDTGTGTATGNYQTLLGDNGPRHGLIAGLFLGASATEETDALQNATATGDVDNGIGTVPAITTNPGGVVTVPITALNLSGTAASVVGFIDFNRDGDFLDTGERSTVVNVPNNSATTTTQGFSLSFTVPTGAMAGTSVLRVRLANDASEISTAVGAASTGEVEDVQIQITLGQTATLQLAKAWGANSVAGNQVTIGATSGGANNTAAFNATAPTAANSGTAVVVGVGNVITLPAETSAALASYTTTVACTGGHTLSGTNGQQTNTLTITSRNAAVCTYTNTPRTATLTLRKQWSGAEVGDDATITVSRGATVLDTLNSDVGAAGELDADATPTTVVIGETVTLAETLATANVGLYDDTLACTGSADADPADGLTIGAADTAITCTYTNTRRTADLSITKTNTPTVGALDQANDTVDSGQATTYTLVVTNDGTTEVAGAVVRDAPGAGITCPPGNAVTISGDGVPAGSFTVADLTGANGIVLGALAAGQRTTLSFNCQVN